MQYQMKETTHHLSAFFKYLESKEVKLNDEEKKSLTSIFNDIADVDKTGALETTEEKSKFWFGISNNFAPKGSDRNIQITKMFFDFWADTFCADVKNSKKEKNESSDSVK